VLHFRKCESIWNLAAVPYISSERGSRDKRVCQPTPSYMPRAKILDLGFCYDPELADLNDVEDMLEVMSKYDVQEEVKRRVRKPSRAGCLKNEPLRVFAIAQRYHLEYETRLAALRKPQFRVEVYCAELERISAGPY